MPLYLSSTYVILRRSGWRSPDDLEAATERSRHVGDEDISDDIRWIRSYVLVAGASSLETVLIYQGDQPRGDQGPRLPGRGSVG